MENVWKNFKKSGGKNPGFTLIMMKAMLMIMLSFFCLSYASMTYQSYMETRDKKQVSQQSKISSLISQDDDVKFFTMTVILACWAVIAIIIYNKDRDNEKIHLDNRAFIIIITSRIFLFSLITSCVIVCKYSNI